MEKELNIAAILKDKPKGTKLYSKPFGECTFDGVTNDDDICFLEQSSSTFRTDGYGKYSPNGECLVFPSKEMQDWSKFAWKKGDVLEYEGEGKIIFDCWANEEYTVFRGVSYYINNGVLERFHTTSNNTIFFNAAKEESAKKYISEWEDFVGGKLDIETLDVNPEFKYGDIVVVENIDGFKVTLIYDRYINKKYCKYIVRSVKGRIHIGEPSDNYLTEDKVVRYATDSEKQQLFSALEKEGKRWNPDTKTVEDLPKKCEFKAFDKVLVRNNDAETWIATLFGFYDKEFENYVCIGDVFEQCIPYNEETAHLLGTTDEWKGGEGYE